VFGLHGMRRVREGEDAPRHQHHGRQLRAALRERARHGRRRDPARHHLLGGIRPCVKAAGICETFQLGVAVHSSGELGIQLATCSTWARSSRTSPSRRRALPPPHGRRGRGGEAEVRRRVDRGARRTGARRAPRREKLARYHELFRRSGPIPTTRTRCGRGGRRSCPTTAGPTRKTHASRRCPCEVTRDEAAVLLLPLLGRPPARGPRTATSCGSATVPSPTRRCSRATALRSRAGRRGKHADAAAAREEAVRGLRGSSARRSRSSRPRHATACSWPDTVAVRLVPGRTSERISDAPAGKAT